MELLNTDTLQEARRKLWEESADLQLGEHFTGLLSAGGSMCAEDITANEDIPPFPRSVVDGYAVRAEDTYGASENGPAFLKVTGNVDIEKKAEKKLCAQETVRVQTGSMLPEGATGVLMTEYAEEYVPGKLAAYRSVADGENVIRKGEDIPKGKCVIKKGRKITASDTGILAALGISRIKVSEKPEVTLISTGDELAGITETLRDGKIRDVNTYVLAVDAQAQGMHVRDTLRLPDNEKIIRSAVESALEQSDIILLSGGSSKGKKDYTKSVFEDLTGNVFTHGISVKPGKPTILAYHKKTETILAGLPGHPMAALLMFRLLIADWYRKKVEAQPAPLYPAVLSENVSSNQGRETCLLVQLRCRKEETGAVCYAVPVHAKSGSISAVSRADGYVMISRDREGMKKGETVWVEVF